jgi:hypothetical protein
MRIVHRRGFVFFFFMVLVSIFAIGVHIVSGLPLWACFLMSVFAVLINGWLATWEDDQPGGFNKPRERPPRNWIP